MRTILLHCCIFLLSTITHLWGQTSNIGELPIQNYSKNIYKGGTQTWDITQGKNGVMYFANNDGLLSFDGKYWALYPIDNNTIVRSLCIDKNGKIFVGGQGEIGYFYPSENGSLKYHSITHLIPDEFKNFTDVWDIIEWKGEIFFRTYNHIFQYQYGDKINAYNTGGAIHYCGLFKDQLIIHDEHKGFLNFEDRYFTILLVDKISGHTTSFIPINEEQMLITTLKEGIFIYDGQSIKPWPTAHDAFLKEKRIYAAHLLSDGNIALGTSLGGLLVIDQKGNAIRHIQKETGLQNANILSVFQDRADNIWLGLDNGIDGVEYESAFTYIYPDNELEGTGYTVKINDGKIYFGTSNGLYQKDWKPFYEPFQSQPYKLVPNTAGQVWGLSLLKDELLMGHHEGAFQIDGSTAKNIAPLNTWLFVPLNKTTAISGNYDGVSLYTKENDDWSFSKKLKGIYQSSRIMMKEKNGPLWMSHPYRGLYKLTPILDKDSVKVDFYNVEQGLPTNLNNSVFSINDKPIFGTEKGVYQYDQKENRFKPYDILNQHIGDHAWVKLLQQDDDEYIWFVTDKNVGYLKIEEDGLQKKITKHIIPELNESLVGGFAHIYPYDANNVFFGSEKGFIRFNPAKEKNTDLTVTIGRASMIASKDSTIFGGYFSDNGNMAAVQTGATPTFSANENAFRFYYAAPNFTSNSKISYQCFLEGMDKDWTNLTDRTEKEYTNLAHGNYTFKVRARDGKNNICEPASYSFKISAPWYKTTLAYIIYALLAIGLLAALMFLQKNKFETEKEQLKSHHEEKEKQQQQIVDQTEQELNTLRNEQLEKEVVYQKKELASATMHIMQKSEMLNSIREQLSKVIQKNNDPALVKKDVEKIIRMLQQDTILDDSWEQFSLHFDQVHSDFLKNLREKYPHLTSYDQKISAYLRMNLSTKEIATLLNISVRGVEGSRYRLRKKLAIPKEENLVKFLQKI